MENEENKEDFEALGSEPRIYEVGYHLLPYVAESDLPAEVSKIKETIVASGGMVFSEEEPKLMALAYPINKTVANKKTKFENAWFGWIKWEGEPKTAIALKKALDLHPNALRFVIVKTIRESTIFRKPAFTPRPSKTFTPAKEELKPIAKEDAPREAINEEELDKTIEELVIQ